MNKDLYRPILPFGSSNPHIQPWKVCSLISTLLNGANLSDVTYEDLQMLKTIGHDDYEYCIKHMGLRTEDIDHFREREAEFFDYDHWLELWENLLYVDGFIDEGWYWVKDVVEEGKVVWLESEWELEEWLQGRNLEIKYYGGDDEPNDSRVITDGNFRY